MIYVYIEANLSWVTANDIANICLHKDNYPIQVMSYDPTKDQRFGVWTGKSEKEWYAREMKQALASGTLMYAEDFITAEPKAVAIKGEIRDQLQLYRRIVTYKDGDDQPTVTYSGKGGGRKDDLAIVLQMLLWWSKLNRASHEYKEAAHHNGWKW